MEKIELRLFTDYMKYTYNLLKNNENIVLLHETVETDFTVPMVIFSIDYLSKNENKLIYINKPGFFEQLINNPSIKNSDYFSKNDIKFNSNKDLVFSNGSMLKFVNDIYSIDTIKDSIILFNNYYIDEKYGDHQKLYSLKNYYSINLKFLYTHKTKDIDILKSLNIFYNKLNQEQIKNIHSLLRKEKIQKLIRSEKYS